MPSATPQKPTAATANQATLVAATWDLKTCDSGAPEIVLPGALGPISTADSVLPGGDKRTLVPDAELKAPHGKYQALVKIFTHFQGLKDMKNWPTATGWLIRPDLLVTAGHVVYDHANKWGMSTQIKAYIGYNGKESIGKPGVQFRYGTKVVLPQAYLAPQRIPYRDCAFIKLNKPFENVTCFKFVPETPKMGKELLGIVGYPGDKTSKGGEQAAFAYQMFVQQNWNLEKDLPSKMLLYQISTYGGQSGSPVIRGSQQTMTSIGTHVGSPGEKTVKAGNEASTIGGAYGNPYSAYLQVFDKSSLPAASVKTNLKLPGVHYVSVPDVQAPQDPSVTEVNNPETGSEAHGNSGNSTGAADGGATDTDSGSSEGFLEALTNAAELSGPSFSGLGPTVLPGKSFLGAAAVPISILAHCALSAASHFGGSGSEALEGFNPAELTAESSLPESLDGIPERALLCESALNTVMTMNRDTLSKTGFTKNMAALHKQMSSRISKIAPKVIPMTMEAALRMAIMYSQPYGLPDVGLDLIPYSKKAAKTESLDAESGGTEAEMDTNLENFAAELVKADHNQSLAEGFTLPVAQLIKVGLKVGSFFLDHQGPEALSDAIQETYTAEVSASQMAGSKFFQALGQRAVLGEAALLAALKAPPSALMEAGFYGGMTESVRGGVRAIPGIATTIGAVYPIVMDLMNRAKDKKETMNPPADGQPAGGADNAAQQDGEVGPSIATQADGQTDGQTEGQAEGQADGQADGQPGNGEVNGAPPDTTIGIPKKPAPSSGVAFPQLKAGDIVLRATKDGFQVVDVSPPIST